MYVTAKYDDFWIWTLPFNEVPLTREQEERCRAQVCYCLVALTTWNGKHCEYCCRLLQPILHLLSLTSCVRIKTCLQFTFSSLKHVSGVSMCCGVNYSEHIAFLLCFQESYRNEAEEARTSARDTTTALGITLGCLLLYAIVMSIVASRDCIRQRWRQKAASNSVYRQSNDGSITGMILFYDMSHFVTNVIKV